MVTHFDHNHKSLICVTITTMTIAHTTMISNTIIATITIMTAINHHHDNYHNHYGDYYLNQSHTDTQWRQIKNHDPGCVVSPLQVIYGIKPLVLIAVFSVLFTHCPH